MDVVDEKRDLHSEPSPAEVDDEPHEQPLEEYVVDVVDEKRHVHSEPSPAEVDDEPQERLYPSEDESSVTSLEEMSLGLMSDEETQTTGSNKNTSILLRGAILEDGKQMSSCMMQICPHFAVCDFI